jgi:hypothetical protein
MDSCDPFPLLDLRNWILHLVSRFVFCPLICIRGNNSIPISGRVKSKIFMMVRYVRIIGLN